MMKELGRRARDIYPFPECVDLRGDNDGNVSSRIYGTGKHRNFDQEK